MALPRALTVEDLYAMPEGERGERYELIDGALFVTPAPTWGHQTVSSNLVRVLDAHVHASRLGWVRDNFGVRVDDRTYVIPDAVFVSRERRHIIGATELEGAPDLIVEILSPSTRRRDLLTKRALFARMGVREYWLIDPDALAVTVLVLKGSSFVDLPPAESGLLTSRVLPELRVRLSDLFEDVDLVPGATQTQE
jgi:Uma2 family endonuclease